MSRATHDRTELHSGIENDYFELLSAPVGSLPAGTDLHVALAYIHNWILQRETTAAAIHLLTANAIIRRTYVVSLTADARITVTVTGAGSFTINAIARRIVSNTFTADAIKRRTLSTGWVADAWINLTGVHGASFTADSEIKDRGLTAIQWRALDGSMTDENIRPDTPNVKLYRRQKFQ